jgi:hypothetical protein
MAFFFRTLMAGALSLVAIAGAAYGQSVSPAPLPTPLEPPTARVAALDVALYNAQANVQEPTDSAKAHVATAVLYGTLARLLEDQLADSARVATAGRAQAARAAAGGYGCNVIVACARAVAKAVDAPWVVLAKVSKTSNLIWLLTGQLVHAPTGTVILDDSTELKGEPETMVRKGIRIFAERVARTVRAGGVTTNFPQMESAGR